ncbi:MAG: pyrroline-5-carboxylate reductase [Phycisphaera sp.]|nr:pyrroline-5-carboxylate reductase [Phycisphaera sp.]
MQYELGSIGAGNMAEAILRAVIDNDFIDASKIIVSDPTRERRELFASLGMATTESNADVTGGAATVMLSVKPQIYPKIADDLGAIDAANQAVISIMTGISIAKMAEAMGASVDTARVIRVMPNTPLLAGEGMSGVASGPGATEADTALAMRIFGAAGEVVTITEAEIDAVTVVSGSGPAYVFYLAEAMAAAARELGLSDDVSDLLTEQTLVGAAKLLRESEHPPAELRRRVTSPGGTTQAAIEHMESQHVRETIVKAIHKAWERSKELGK